MCFLPYATYAACGHAYATRDMFQCAFARGHPALSVCPFHKGYEEYEVDGLCSACLEEVEREEIEGMRRNVGGRRKGRRLMKMRNRMLVLLGKDEEEEDKKEDDNEELDGVEQAESGDVDNDRINSAKVGGDNLCEENGRASG
ncbi:hypothetical protein K458DRAFT_399897 [Lentithecium fluviatile CBS 122367]|uniref:Uncharacterized protein n=1 Tax=Lentithecium fluviatile CBS 122367 TaxID=1168545 RepID=A0A6G1JG00_9PLEO|nr:hypothetical protein K458DRAFT_399897 [Lentithecium fluviatile CBS 122367]